MATPSRTAEAPISKVSEVQSPRPIQNSFGLDLRGSERRALVAVAPGARMTLGKITYVGFDEHTQLPTGITATDGHYYTGDEVAFAGGDEKAIYVRFLREPLKQIRRQED